MSKNIAPDGITFKFNEETGRHEMHIEDGCSFDILGDHLGYHLGKHKGDHIGDHEGDLNNA